MEEDTLQVTIIWWKIKTDNHISSNQIQKILPKMLNKINKTNLANLMETLRLANIKQLWVIQEAVTLQLMLTEQLQVARKNK
jgi:hypothetical protein